jgi:L-cysteine desulfidase
VAFAFLLARRHLNGPFDPHSVKAQLYASPEVLRNASTAVVPFLNRRGLRTVVAAGLSSRSNQFNLFPNIERRVAHILLRRRSWLSVKRTARRKGIYVEAVLCSPTESVSVVIQGRHDEVRAISHNGKTIFRSPPHRQQLLGMPEIMKTVAKRDRRMEEVERDFLVRQVRGDLFRAIPQRIAALIRARMCGSSSPVMTVTGSGNHGILLGVPFYALYRKYGRRILPAALFSLLAVIHMTGKRNRISEECGLATKAAPALAAGLAFAQGANLAEITRAMRSVSCKLRHMKCSGALPSCGRKAEQVLEVVLVEVKAGTHGK